MTAKTEHDRPISAGQGPVISGKWFILVVGFLALGAASFAWVVQYQRGKRVLELWGTSAAMLIRVDAKKIELLVLEEAKGRADAKTLQLGEAERQIARTIDVTNARGIIHARQALIEDYSFSWDQPRGDCAANWEYALRFADGAAAATILIDTNCQRAQLLEKGSEASIAPIAKGLQIFIDDQLATKKSP